MVKINPSVSLSESAKPASSGSRPVGESTFRQVLDQVRSPSVKKVNNSQPTAGTESILPTGALHHPLLAQAELVVSTMETYRLDLLNPEKTLKDLEETLKQLNRQVEDLRHDSETCSTLQNLVQGIAVAAEVERIKFERGDYLD